MPMRTRIKICGVRDVAIAQAAVDAGVDAIGLVFVPASPRYVTLAQARAIVASLPALVEPIGLFVNTPMDEVRLVAAALGLRTVQLHGDETPEQAASLMPLRVIRSLSFTPEMSTDTLPGWKSIPNLGAILFDAPPPTQEKEPTLTGGSGRRFDWTALGAWRADQPQAASVPMILAGGLTPLNVGDAIRLLQPYAVDVSTGVESQRGVKDASRIAMFAAAVRRADAALSAPLAIRPGRGDASAED